MTRKSLLLLAFAASSTCLAAQTAQTAPQADFKKGAVYGQVEDTAGKPVAGATVAVKSPEGKVIAWGKTDAKGDYALDVDPKTALNLRPSRHRGLLEECATGVGDVVMAPVKVISTPGQTVKSAVESVASGTPAPLVGQTVKDAIPTKNQVQGAAAAGALGDGPTLATPKKGKKGEAMVVVSASGYKDADVTPNAYWFEGPEQRGTGLRAWVEPVKLAATSGKDSSGVVPEAITISNGTALPTLVPPGSSVAISVKLNQPPGVDHPVRIFARDSRKATVVELKPGPDKVTYTGQMTFDKDFPAGDDTICVAALRAMPVEVKLPHGKDPLPLFVRRCDDMEPTKSYEYDPMIMASENRADVKVTVLPKK